MMSVESKGKKKPRRAVMKNIVLIPIEREEKKGSNRRADQRRMAVPRRVKPERRGNERVSVPKEIADRREPRQRRRLPDRRLGLKFDLKDLE
jgi:hypothetical protein